MKYSEVISVLDIGNTKVCCCIARLLKNNKIEILGSGCCACNGMNLGVITEMESVEKSVSKAIETAEKQAKYRVKSVYVSASGINVKSYLDRVSINIGGRVIKSNDIKKSLNRVNAPDKSLIVLHKIPISFALDNLNCIKNPLGMVADKMEIDLAVITAPKSQLNNIVLCLNKCHLDIKGFVASQYALGQLIPHCYEDVPGQVIVADIGGGVTTISFLYKGIFCGSEIIPLGGAYITGDISNKLGITYSDAERLKVLYGTALTINNGDNSQVLAPIVGENNYISIQQISKSSINSVIVKDSEELANEIKELIADSVFGTDFCNNIMITGGVSQMIGLDETLFNIAGKRATPLPLEKLIALSDTEISPAYAVSLGMIFYAQNEIDMLEEDISEDHENKIYIQNSGKFKRLIEWFKENL